MSALGQKQTLGHLGSMSALPPKADIRLCDCHVRFVPKADIGSRPGWRRPTTGMADCCARAASGHAAAAPPTSVMNSRRLIGWPLKQRVLPYHAVSCIVCITANSSCQCPLWVKSRHRGLLKQSLLYPQKRTLELIWEMSALCQKRTLR